jgi:RNA polymerase sigma-70 factor (ECF subfamily)
MPQHINPNTADAAAAEHARMLAALLERIASGEQAALKVLYDLSAAKLYGVAMRIVRNSEWAEDVLQDTYLQIWRNAGDYRASLAAPLTWMAVIVRSRALDFLRRRSAERLNDAEEFNDELHDGHGGEPDPSELVLAGQEARALNDCLSRLEARQREVVVLAYLRDLSHSELADQLKLPLGTVKTWIRRGLERLRGCLQSKEGGGLAL